MSAICHIVWDWNGTLLDDFAVTAQITIEALAGLGVENVTPDQIRDAFRRPLKDFFAVLMGQEPEASTLADLGQRYLERYGAALGSLALAADAHDVLTRAGGRLSQSLLSMAPHAQIDRLVDHHGIRRHFSLVQGYLGSDHPTKQQSLDAHFAALGHVPSRCCLIGDTVDDFEAARAAGAAAVLVATGMQSRRRLEATGAPVVDSLTQAFGLIEGLAHG